MVDGEVQRVRRDGAVELLQRRARVLGAGVALRIAERAHHVLFVFGRCLQHRRNCARIKAPLRLGERFRGGAGQRGAAAQCAGEHDAALQQGAAMQQAVAGDEFERRRAAAFAFPHGFTPDGSASRDAVRFDWIVGADGTSPTIMLRYSTAVVNREIRRRYSITSSAVARSAGGMSRPSALAVLRLMTSSNLVGCGIGRSPGFSPLRMRPT